MRKALIVFIFSIIGALMLEQFNFIEEGIIFLEMKKEINLENIFFTFTGITIGFFLMLFLVLIQRISAKLRSSNED
ncbi:MAG: hypothetical protein P8J93_05815 [SAR86 cluster bacterium]|jgi:hypothetical protein|nr:hypothetical protein [SAR86 cluster bacterium]